MNSMILELHSTILCSQFLACELNTSVSLILFSVDGTFARKSLTICHSHVARRTLPLCKEIRDNGGAVVRRWDDIPTQLGSDLAIKLLGASTLVIVRFGTHNASSVKGAKCPKGSGDGVREEMDGAKRV